MSSLSRNLILVALSVLTLSACTSPDDEEALSETQKYYFLESLKTVEQAGRSLQSKSLTQKDIREALAIMDQGMELAFQVESEFLDRLDARLDKNYQRYFVKGVESYRLGIEAGDRKQQQEGLRLLTQWAEFWALAKPAVDEKLRPK
ncbi:MAG: hypothetical protein ACC663_12610 [Gammaproteobacteria bacterium]